MKKLLAFLMALTMLLSLVACGGNNSGKDNGKNDSASSDSKDTTSDAGSSDSAAEPIKIGVFQPLTGANAAGGQLEYEGIQLANKLYPEVLGRPVELVVVDNKSDQVEAATAAARLVEEEEVDVVLGSWGSSLSMAGGDSFKNTKTPAIACSATSPNVTLGNDYYFRVCFLENFMGVAMSSYASDVLGVTRGAMICEVTNDTNMGIRAVINEEFPARGGEIVAEASYSVGDQDFTSQIMTVMANDPEVVFIASNYAEAALLIKQARGLGYDVPFLGTDTLDVEAFIEVGGADVEGVVYCTFFDSEATINDVTEQFVTEYREMFDAEGSALAALGFDSYLAAIRAIEAAGSTDGEAVQAALDELTFDGATGTITFDENGDAVKDMIVLRTVKDGKATYHDTYYIDDIA